MADPYSIIANYKNPGETMVNAFTQGQAQAKQRAEQEAMRALAANPNNPGAFEALAKANPQLAMQFRERQQQQQMQGLEQHREKIKLGAAIVRQVKPQDQNGWNQVLGMAQQYGIDLADVPKQWDEQTQAYAQGLDRLANVFDPPKNQEPTSFQRDYEFLRGKDPQLAEQFIRNRAEGSPIVQQNADGTTTLYPRSMIAGGGAPQGGGLPTVSDQASYDAVPNGAQYMSPDGQVRVKGGQSGAAPTGNFPR